MQNKEHCCESFHITGNELAKIENWMEKHESARPGPIGGRYTYSFTPTTLGTVIKVTDAITKEELDATEYESW